MKSKWIFAGIAIILILGLSSCGRFKGNSGTNNSQVQTTPTAVLDQPALSTATPAGAADEITPESTQPTTPALQPQSPTATPTAVVIQAVDTAQLRQTANDLSDALNNLSKDLNSTDTMDDLK